jgi:Tfp pilus assembly ATPase PilU
MEQVELDNAEQKVGSYLNVMVTNDGSDLFLHTGAKPTIKGSFGFKVLDEICSLVKPRRCCVAC